MISRIKGKLVQKQSNSILVDINGLTYQVFIPLSSLSRIDEHTGPDGTVDLVTFHYHQVEPSRSIPVLIGFLNEIEKEFFECFITVSGIGPRAALRALNQPISSIAAAIDAGDLSFLRSLPGIGQQRAKEIVAKLQNKVGKFGLIKDDMISQEKPDSSIHDEAQAVLMQLGYRKPEAMTMIKKALECGTDIKTTEELLNEVYKQKRS